LGSNIARAEPPLVQDWGNAPPELFLKRAENHREVHWAHCWPFPLVNDGIVLGVLLSVSSTPRPAFTPLADPARVPAA
jgi:hypothetical protein